MTSEKIEIKLSDEHSCELINLYIAKHMSEATQDLIIDDFAPITTKNVKEVAFAAMQNEMIIHVLEEQIKRQKEESNAE